MATNPITTGIRELYTEKHPSLRKLYAIFDNILPAGADNPEECLRGKVDPLDLQYQKQALIKLMLEYAWNAPAEGLQDRDGVENFRWGLQTLELLDSLQRLHIHAALPGALVAAGVIEEREKAEVPT